MSSVTIAIIITRKIVKERLYENNGEFDHTLIINAYKRVINKYIINKIKNNEKKENNKNN